MEPHWESPFKSGTAENMTFRMAEQALINDKDAGKGVEAISRGLAYLLTVAFKIPAFAFRGFRRALAYGTLTRWTIVGALIGCAFGLFLSINMHDELMRAQFRIVPVGAIVGLLLGLVRVRMARR